MKSMVLPAPADAESRPLQPREGAVPEPAADELPVRVATVLLYRLPDRDYLAALARAADDAPDDATARARVTALVLTSPEYHLT